MAKKPHKNKLSHVWKLIKPSMFECIKQIAIKIAVQFVCHWLLVHFR